MDNLGKLIIPGINTFTGLNDFAPQKTFLELLAAGQQIGSFPCNLYAYYLVNPNASDVFVKLFNRATIPAVGITVPDLTVQVKANSSVVLAGSDILMGFPLNMWAAATTGYSKISVGAPGLAVYSYFTFKDNQS